jgi:hypothetical protein
MEPISHFFYSHRLKLQFWDWGVMESRRWCWCTAGWITRATGTGWRVI